MSLNARAARSNEESASGGLRSLTNATPRFTSADASSTCDSGLFGAAATTPAQIAIGQEVQERPSIVATVVRIISQPEFALGVIVELLPVAGFAPEQFSSRSGSFREAPTSRRAIALKVANFRHEKHRPSTAPKRVGIERIQVLPPIVIESAIADAFEHIKAADRLQLAAQVGQHEFHEPVGL